ncbi:MAG: hypothetical protein NT062_12765 [Proteobacteria bacterium]|nr:hypothetical protein [Pseudomonadota bacterium]
MPDPDVEARARAIADAAKQARQPLPRGLWILAILVGLACAVAAGLALQGVRTAPLAADVRPAPPTARGGFGLGIGLGLGAGLVIGFALARRRR